MLLFGGLLSHGGKGGHVDVAKHLCFCMMVVKGCGQDRVLLSMCVLEVHFLRICSF